MPTRNELRQLATLLNLSYRCTDFGEHRINLRTVHGGTEATAYYTDDSQDAADTMRAIAKERDTKST